VQHLLAAINEMEEKVSSGHISREDADAAIQNLRNLHERLNRIEEKLNVRDQ